MKIKTNTTENLRISGLKQLATPRELKAVFHFLMILLIKLLDIEMKSEI